MFCPMINGDCKQTECAFFKDANTDCAITALPLIAERLEDLTDAVHGVKSAITNMPETAITL